MLPFWYFVALGRCFEMVGVFATAGPFLPICTAHAILLSDVASHAHELFHSPSSGVVAHGSAQNVSFARGRGGVFMGAGGSGQGGMWRNDAAFQGAKDHLPPHMQQEFIPRR